MASRNLANTPFKRLVILGESTVEGGPWLASTAERFADVLVDLIDTCQAEPVEYCNKGIGANAISPRSPGYEASAKPSALERYRTDVIDLEPDLFILCYGLNDMRAGMAVADFHDDMATILADVREACDPMIVLTTIYYMTGWKSYPPFDQGSEELTERYNACIRGLAGEFDCAIADVWAAEGGADWLINYDGVHANKVGNLVLAHAVFGAVARHAGGLAEATVKRDKPTDWARDTMQSRAEAGDPFVKSW